MTRKNTNSRTFDRSSVAQSLDNVITGTFDKGTNFYFRLYGQNTSSCHSYSVPRYVCCLLRMHSRKSYLWNYICINSKFLFMWRRRDRRESIFSALQLKTTMIRILKTRNSPPPSPCPAPRHHQLDQCYLLRLVIFSSRTISSCGGYREWTPA